MSPPPRPAENYARTMANVLHGHALYNPHPSSCHHNYHLEGTNLFDVSWIDTTGNLQYGFSTSWGKEEPRNLDNQNISLAPDKHVLYPHRHKQNETTQWKEDMFYTSARAEIKVFGFKANITVPVVIPAGVEGVVKCLFLNNTSAVLHYLGKHTVYRHGLDDFARLFVVENGISWLELLNSKGHGIHNGDLFFITTCHKARKWQTGVVANAESGREVSLSFSVAGVGGGGLFGNMGETCGSAIVLEGPSKDAVHESQCTVIDGWTIRLSRFRRSIRLPVPVGSGADKFKQSAHSDWVPFGSSFSDASLSFGFGREHFPRGALQKARTSGGDGGSSHRPDRASGASPSIHQIVDTQPDVELYRNVNYRTVSVRNRSKLLDMSFETELRGYHVMRNVLDVIEESAAGWMVALVAHSCSYEAVLTDEDQELPSASELAHRMMRDFVLIINRGGTGTLLNRNHPQVKDKPLAFLLNFKRELTEMNMGFDVVCENVPSGLILLPPAYGCGASLFPGIAYDQGRLFTNDFLCSLSSHGETRVQQIIKACAAYSRISTDILSAAAEQIVAVAFGEEKDTDFFDFSVEDLPSAEGGHHEGASTSTRASKVSPLVPVLLDLRAIVPYTSDQVPQGMLSDRDDTLLVSHVSRPDDKVTAPLTAALKSVILTAEPTALLKHIQGQYRMHRFWIHH